MFARPPGRGVAGPARRRSRGARLLDRGLPVGREAPPPSPRMSPAARLLCLVPAALLACGHGEPSRSARRARARAGRALGALEPLPVRARRGRARGRARRGGHHHLRGAGVRDAPRGVGGRPAGVRRGAGAGRARTSRCASDRLLAWKWKDRVPTANAATDADQDAALALVLAVAPLRRAALPRRGARGSSRDIWEQRGDPRRRPLAPDRRQLGAGASGTRPSTSPTSRPTPTRSSPRSTRGDPGRSSSASSYDVLRFLYVDEGVALPPESVYARPAQRRAPARAPRRRRRARAVRLRRGADLLARRARRALVRAARRGRPARADAALPARGLARRGAAPRPRYTTAGRAALGRSTACRTSPRCRRSRAVEDPALAEEMRAAQARRALRAGALRRAAPRTTSTTGSGSGARSSSA